jgi:hypothetical protein
MTIGRKAIKERYTKSLERKGWITKQLLVPKATANLLEQYAETLRQDDELQRMQSSANESEPVSQTVESEA